MRVFKSYVLWVIFWGHIGLFPPRFPSLGEICSSVDDEQATAAVPAFEQGPKKKVNVLLMVASSDCQDFLTVEAFLPLSVRL